MNLSDRLHYHDIIYFWFEECTPKQWWQKSLEFDCLIASRFGVILQAAIEGKLAYWRSEAEGRLAEIIVLDQFSRNIYRDRPQAFSQDPLALNLAREAVQIGADKAVSEPKRVFFYLPYMHSESLQIHQEALPLFQSLTESSYLEYEYKHMSIIEKFDRYPHRNDILDRESTELEKHFLSQPGSSF
ncbi:MAG: DUF924 domain-containing protein [Cyanobacteria bacterium SBLK]|nr:DUF924 domain-containing protein [Cyanobacteria bacterium SBLK]